MDMQNKKLKACARCSRHVSLAKLYDVRGALVCAACGRREIQEYKALINENLASISKGG